MELHDLKAAWQQQMQQKLSSSEYTLQELDLRFQFIEKHHQKIKRENRFWLIVILAGMGICLTGFSLFRLQYTPEKFPHIRIALYDAGFITGMVFLSLKVLLSYWYNKRYDQLMTRLYSSTLKDSLHGMRKNFEFIYCLSIILCLVLLPPLLFLQIKLLSPVLGWSLHQQLEETILATILITLFFTVTGHAIYQYSFNKEMRKLNGLLADLEEPSVRQ